MAALLGISTPTVYAAIRRAPPRQLAHIRTPGGQIRVRRRDVLAYCHIVGMAVPTGLVPPNPLVAVIHPNHRQSNRLRVILAGRHCAVAVYKDIIDGLLGVGESRPSLVLVSQACGREVVLRLCAAVADMPDVGYMPVVLLVTSKPRRWQGGPVPLPLEARDPTHVERSDIGNMVAALLGLD